MKQQNPPKLLDLSANGDGFKNPAIFDFCTILHIAAGFALTGIFGISLFWSVMIALLFEIFENCTTFGEKLQNGLGWGSYNGDSLEGTYSDLFVFLVAAQIGLLYPLTSLISKLFFVIIFMMYCLFSLLYIRYYP